MTDHFSLGFISGLVVGLAAAVLIARLAIGIRWISGLFGRDPLAKKLRESEKKLQEAVDEATRLNLRLKEKDELIRKAMVSAAKEKALRGE